MAANNLRVIYDNLIDLSTTSISASGTAAGGVYVANNLKRDAKSQTWRGTENVKIITLTVGFGSARTVSGVFLGFTNLTSTATIKVTATGVTVGTNPSTLGAVLCRPWADASWDTAYTGGSSNSYGYGAGSHARVWFSSDVTCTGLTIEITDTANTNTSLEVSRLVVGKLWSPKYNTEFGLEVGVKDLTTQSRTQSGDLISTRGPRFKTLNFNLNWLTYTDRTVFINLLKTAGLSRSLLVSLFPNNSDDWDAEQLYQIYGKLTDTPGITHPMFSVYASSVTIEEV